MRGVGPALAEKLAKLGVTQVQDLLFVLPSRYEDRTQVSEIGALRHGTRVVVEGEVQLTEVAYRRRRQLLCRISDGTGSLTLRFFYFSGAQQANLARGTRIRCFGEVRRGPLGPRDRASGVPAHRRRSGAARRSADAYLPDHRGRAAGAAALADRPRAARDRAARACATGFRRAMLADLELPSLLDALDDDASAAARRASGRAR